jgi:hypothetical protein
MDLVWPQDHIDKASKSSWQVADVFGDSYVFVVGLIFTLGTLPQVGARPKEMENTPRNPLDVLHLGHLLRRLAKASKLSWRPNPCQVQVHLRLQEQPIVRRPPKSHTDSALTVHIIWSICRCYSHLGLHFALDHFIFEQSPLSFCETPHWDLNHTSTNCHLSCVLSLSCLCSSICSRD